MKNKIIIFGVLFSILLPSCSDWLDPKPTNELVAEDYWKKTKDVQDAIMACYQGMTQEGFIERIVVGGEVRADNIELVSNREDRGQSLKDLIECNITPTNMYAKWEPFYKVINYCNTVLANAPSVKEFDPDYTDGLFAVDSAEVITIRSLVYFYLVRLYKDVPYIDFPYSDDNVNFNVKKASGDSILKVLVTDLERAERKAVKTRGNGFLFSQLKKWNKGRITKNAVRALLADIYLWQGDYAKVISVCNTILEDVRNLADQNIDYTMFSGSELYLIPNTENLRAYSFANTFYPSDDLTGGSTSRMTAAENIFELVFDNVNKGKEAVKRLYSSKDAQNSAFLTVHQSLNSGNRIFPALVDGKEVDVRKENSYGKFLSDSEIIKKYVVETSIGGGGGGSISYDTPFNWIFYRLADIILMRAEAYIELGSPDDFEEAYKAIMEVNKRSNLATTAPVKPTFDKKTMRKFLLDERQREFLFEGKRWFDLVRFMERDKSSADIFNDYLARIYPFDKTVVEEKYKDLNALYLPIHRDELRSNGNLEQNSFYFDHKEVEEQDDQESNN